MVLFSNTRVWLFILWFHFGIYFELYLWNVVMEGLLIELVQSFPHLYDIRHTNFKNNEVKENSWKTIAITLNITVDDCKKMWRNLRDRYAREKKALPTGSAAFEVSEWEYFHQMSFLKDIIKPRKTYTNASSQGPVASSSVSQSQIESQSLLQRKFTPKKMKLLEQCQSESPFNTLGTILNSEFSDHDNDSNTENPSTIINPTNSVTQSSQFVDVSEMNENDDETQISNIAANKTQDNSRNKVKQAKSKAEPKAQDDDLRFVAKNLADNLNNTILKQKPSANSAFGQYVALTLNMLPGDEQKKKRRHICNILENDN